MSGQQSLFPDRSPWAWDAQALPEQHLADIAKYLRKCLREVSYERVAQVVGLSSGELADAVGLGLARGQLDDYGGEFVGLRWCRREQRRRFALAAAYGKGMGP